MKKQLYVIRDTTWGHPYNHYNKDMLKGIVRLFVKEPCRVIVVPAIDQKYLLPDEGVINLDPFSRKPGHYPLDICRKFGADQHHPMGFQSRTSESIHDQLAKIPAGNYLLVDDDIASGSTRDFVLSEISKHDHLKTTKMVSLLQLWLGENGFGEFPVFDCIDTHDFWGNLPTSGLMVNGSREYYWSNKVDLGSRAKFNDPNEAAKYLRRDLML